MLLATRSVRDHLRTPRRLTIRPKPSPLGGFACARRASGAIPVPGRAGHCPAWQRATWRGPSECWIVAICRTQHMARLRRFVCEASRSINLVRWRSLLSASSSGARRCFTMHSAVVPRAGGRLHRPDDAQVERREVDVERRAIASVRRLTTGSPRQRQPRRARQTAASARLCVRPAARTGPRPPRYRSLMRHHAAGFA